MFFIIILITALILGLIFVPNETTGFIKWVFTGFRGVASDAVALQKDAKRARLENPETINETIASLNTNIIDTKQYALEARARSIASSKNLAAMNKLFMES